MKKIMIAFIVAVCFCQCREKKEKLGFILLTAGEFNSKPFELPVRENIDSLKKAHDNCMGFAFDANASLVQSKDSFRIGSIINRSSLKVLNTLGSLGLSMNQMATNFNIIANPCYEKMLLDIPLKSILGEHFNLQVPNANAAINKEINEAIDASPDAEMQTGSWYYLDMQDVLVKILDTIKTAEGLAYKKNLLDSTNMILMAEENVSDVSFIINTVKEISAPLQALLQTKPYVTQANSPVSIKIVYINSNKFQIIINGYFPAAGKLMKAVII